MTDYVYWHFEILHDIYLKFDLMSKKATYLISNITFFVVLQLLSIQLNAQTEGDWLWYKSQDNIRSIDTYGDDVWIGTYKGVTKFNQATKMSTHYSVFNSDINSSEVEDLVVDDFGKVWIGTYDAGLKTFDPTTNIWQTFDKTNSNIPSDSVYQVAKGNNGDIWIATESGLSVFNGTQFINWNYEFPAIISGNLRDVLFDLKIDASDVAWISSFTLVMYDHGIWYDFFDDNVFSYSPPSLIIDDQQRIWYVGDLSHRITDTLNVEELTSFAFQYRFITQTDDLNFYTSDGIGLFEVINDMPVNQNQEFPFAQIPSFYKILDYVFTDTNGKPAAHCGNNLLFLNDQNEWEFYDVLNEDLLNNNVLDIEIDETGNVWIGTWTGVSIIGEDQWANPLDLIGERVYSLLPENDGMWIGTQQSELFYRRTGEVDQPVSFELPFAPLDIQITSNGDKWIQYESGLHWFNDTENEYLELSELPITGLWVQAFDIDQEDRVWIGDGFGSVFRREHDGSWTTFNQTNSILNFHYTRDIYTDPNGVTWLTAHNYDVDESYLYKYDGQQWELVTTNDYTYFGFSMLMNSSNELWINNTSEVQKYDGANWTTYERTEIPSLNLSGFIRTLALDENDNLWVGASSGISILLESPLTTGHGESVELDLQLSIYPNPATEFATIRFELPENQILTMDILDITGRVVQSITDSKQYVSGHHDIIFNVEASSGLYWIRIQDETQHSKMIPIAIIR